MLRGVSLADWPGSGRLLDEDATSSKRPWERLPKKWPEFSHETLIASGGRYVPFDPYKYQEDLVRTIRDCTNTYVL